MKFKKTDHWTDKNTQAGLLFFAQILDEALFDYSLETYKPQALNVRLLCIECLQTIDYIKQGIIKKPNLKSIVDELIWSLNSDYATRRILGTKFDRIVERIKKYENNYIELRGSILHLYHHFDKRKYLNYLKSYLIDLVPQNKEKDHINSLSRTILTELINYGYLPGYIYYQVNQHFFNHYNPVSENHPKIFLDKFDFNKRKFTVIFRVDNVFNDFQSLSKLLKFSIHDDYHIQNIKGKEKEFISKKPKRDVFIVFENVESTDEISARYLSELPVERLANMFSFFHHREKPKIYNKALVINNQTGSFLLLDKPIKSIIKKEDIKPKEAANKVRNIFETLDLPMDTIVRLTKAFDIHSIALESDELENKLLNLWTGIETLIPKNTECGQDRIIQIVQSLVPFQTVYYLKNLMNQVASDFYFYDKRLASSILKKVITKEKESRWYSIAALIASKENEPIRESIYSKLDNFPLLRWRIFNINKFFSTGKSTRKLLKNHVQKVEWQIRRIYRVRNLIVHAGTMPSYTNILVENLHNYFDNLVNYIIDSAISQKNIRSIKEGIIACDIDVNELQHNIDQIRNDEINLDNFKLIT